MTENRKSEIKSAYKNLGKAHSLYDGMMTHSNLIGKLIDSVVWQMNKDDLLEYQAQAFSALPSDFSGKLLEVPVGTGVLSMPVFKTLPEADITCLDYSEKMMATAQRRAKEMGIKNITFTQGDVGSLPFEDGCFDALVSLNGFHAFPDKNKAFSETNRVLKKGVIFCGCLYVENANTHTDKIIRRLYIKSGFFTPPFDTVESLKSRLEAIYTKVEIGNVKSIVWFRCIK